MPRVMKQDANNAYFRERSLETVLSNEYDREYAPREAMALLPQNNEAGEGDDVIRWRAKDRTGEAQFMAHGGDDAPRVDVYGEEYTAQIRTLHDAYGYTWQDMRRAAKSGQPLPQDRATAAREAIEDKKNDIAWYGDKSRGLHGLLTAPATQDIAIVVSTTTTTAPYTSWTKTSGKTPSEIIADLTNLVEAISIATKSKHDATHLVLPRDRRGYLMNTEISAGAGVSILKWFMDNNPSVTIEWSNTFNGVKSGFLPSGTSGTDHVAMAYEKRPENLAFMNAMPFLQHDPEVRNLEFVVTCEERNGGVIIWRPLTVAFMEGM